MDPALRGVGEHPWDLDLTELDSLDNLAAPTGVLLDSQAQVASWLGAARTFFLVQGATGGLHALLWALARSGEAIAFPRASHLSIWHGCTLAGPRAIVLDPGWDDALALPRLPEAEACRDQLMAVEGLRAIVLTRPDYHGRCLELAPWVELANELGVFLVVDEAHGSHLGACQGLPPGALASGAHAVVQSVHKTLGGLTQAAALHLGPGGPDPERVQRALRAITTTSPSYLLLASIEAAYAQLARHGRQAWSRLLGDLDACRASLRDAGVPLLGEDMSIGWASDRDPTRLVVDAGRWRRDPGAVAGWLSGSGIELELVTERYLGALVTPGHEARDLEALAFGFIEAGRAIPAGDPARTWPPPAGGLRRMTLGEAWRESGDACRLEEAIGRVSVEFVAPYPPGLPLLTPGEFITETAIEELVLRRSAGASFVGPADPSLETLRTCPSPC